MTNYIKKTKIEKVTAFILSCILINHMNIIKSSIQYVLRYPTAVLQISWLLSMDIIKELLTIQLILLTHVTVEFKNTVQLIINALSKLYLGRKCNNVAQYL